MLIYVIISLGFDFLCFVTLEVLGQRRAYTERRFQLFFRGINQLNFKAGAGTFDTENKKKKAMMALARADITIDVNMGDSASAAFDFAPVADAHMRTDNADIELVVGQGEL